MLLWPSLASLPLALLLWWNEPFTFEVSQQTAPGGEAYVVINAQQPAPGITVTIEGDDGTKVVRSMSLKGGGSKKITWKQKGKTAHYRLNIKGGDVDTDFEFDVIKARAGGTPGLSMVASREDIVDRHIIKYKTSFVISSYLFQVYNTNGDVIKQIEKNDAEVDVGGVVELSWDSPDEVFMVYFKAEDDAGRFAEDRRVPWAVEIPHTEVNFDTAKWDIKPGEAPKVDEAFAVLVHELDGLEQANRALGPDFKDKITASLYIVGYTDTVGSPADNQKLSHNRAKEIAKYFHDKGAWCSIYYAGMGERGLAVETGDSVDEVRNRRALYLLMPDPQQPAAGGKIPGRWDKLAGASTRMLQDLPPLPQSYLDYKAEQKAERERKFGKGEAAGTGDSGEGDEGGGDGEWGKGAGSDGGGMDPDQRVEPEPVEGDEAGTATGKGCSVGSTAPAPAALGLWVLALARRRRGRGRAAARAPSHTVM
jgi:outer membrane protein OmpA-like peptidoglycan-associated protein